MVYFLPCSTPSDTKTLDANKLVATVLVNRHSIYFNTVIVTRLAYTKFIVKQLVLPEKFLLAKVSNDCWTGLNCGGRTDN